ncbi:helix-turn-helix domain-containing protein [Pimelobacter simplex]|uniref:helix-turn-helix domain-containing protein n=1 Tax=Nocardioides simplex TaxID=2045 RepID=UPI003FCEBC2E
MAAHEPVDPRARLAIAQWPDDAPRGAVSTFCAERGISRKSFYELRRRAQVEGPAAILEPRTRRPRSSPARLSEEVKAQAIQVRAALEASGLDRGPRPGRSRAQPGGGSTIPPRTPASSSTPPSTS